jgi:hypothetical protein
MVSTPPQNNPTPELIRPNSGSHRVIGINQSSVSVAVKAFTAYAIANSGGNQGVLTWILTDGRTIKLTSGGKGMKHILERHVGEFYNGTAPVTTNLFRVGTQGTDIVAWMAEAVKQQDTALPQGKVATNPIVLTNGLTIKLQLNNDQVYSVFVDRPDGIWGFNVLTDVEPFVTPLDTGP